MNSLRLLILLTHHTQAAFIQDSPAIQRSIAFFKTSAMLNLPHKKNWMTGRFCMRCRTGSCIGLLLVGLISGCATAQDPTCQVGIPDKTKTLVKAPAPDSGMQVLQRRLYERDKQIAELRNQLETLKHIDMDVRINKKAHLSSKDPSQ